MGWGRSLRTDLWSEEPDGRGHVVDIGDGLSDARLRMFWLTSDLRPFLIKPVARTASLRQQRLDLDRPFTQLSIREWVRTFLHEVLHHVCTKSLMAALKIDA